MRIPKFKLPAIRLPRKPRRQAVLSTFTAVLKRSVRQATSDILALVPPLPLVPPARKDAAKRPRPAQAAGSFSQGRFTSAAGTREYKLFIPGGGGIGGAMPLVVMLHGCGQDPDDFAAGTGMNELAQARGFAVLYPAQCASANRSRCWNWYVAANQTRGLGEAALIADMTRATVANHALDRNRVYVAGLSAGGAMAAILAAEYPDLYAAVGVHSGLRPGAAKDVFSALAAMRSGQVRASSRSSRPAAEAPTWPFTSRAAGQRPAAAGTTLLRPAPLIAFHGDADATVHPLNAVGVIDAVLGEVARTTVTRRVDAQRSQRAYTQTVYRQGDAPASAQRPTRAESWIVHGGEHAWSGGNASGSHVDATGPDASREMLRFFLEHPLAQQPRP